MTDASARRTCPDLNDRSGVVAGLMASLKARAAAAAAAPGHEAGKESSDRDVRLDQRRERLRHAGVVDRPMLDALVSAEDAPAPVRGHPGSVAACEAVAAFAADRSQRNLVLCGPTGTGKTWAASWILAGEWGLFLPASVVSPDGDWSAVRRRAHTSALCVLNDLRADQVSDWAAGELAGLICTRHDAGLRTVITANIAVWRKDAAAGAPTVESRYGDRVADRLADARVGRIVACRGLSIRRMAP